MEYLARARDAAEARGYLSCPEVLALQRRVPAWFQALGTDSGAAEFEARRAIKLPAALREFYRCTPLACFIEAAADGEVFLNALGEIDGPDLPPVIAWPTGPHIVFSFHNHSGAVLAAELGQDDPRVFAGFDDEPTPFSEEDWPTRSFSDLIFGVVEGHEAMLDHWQGVYEKRQPELGVEWVRGLPGMAARLDRG
jgi:hypothetical protein